MMTDTRLEKKQRTRRNLIESALKISSAEGFSSLSIRKLTKEAGVTPTAFYRHFHDLDELALVLVDEVGVILRQIMRQARQRITESGGIVRNSVETFLKYVADHENLFRILLGERQGSSQSFRKALHAEIDLFVADLTEDLERLNDYPKNMSQAHLAAEAIVAVVFTVGAEAIGQPKLRRIDIAERIIKEVRLILRGAASMAEEARAQQK